MSSSASFASALLADLRRKDSRAKALLCRSRGDAAVIGIEDEGEFVPLLRLGAGSAKFNVMSLFVQHHGRWMPTLKRGIPKTLAEYLAGPFSYLWTIPLEMAQLSGPDHDQ